MSVVMLTCTSKISVRTLGFNRGPYEDTTYNNQLDIVISSQILSLF